MVGASRRGRPVFIVAVANWGTRPASYVALASNQPDNLIEFCAFPPRSIQLSSVTGIARNPLGNGKLLGVRARSDLPTTLRTKSRFTVSPASGSSVHFADRARDPHMQNVRSNRIFCIWADTVFHGVVVQVRPEPGKSRSRTPIR
jgi:hypothetical protein